MQRTGTINNFIEFVNAIIKRPAMFAVNNVEDLDLVILGQMSACAFASSEFEPFNDWYCGLRVFANKEFETGKDHDWARLVRFSSGGDRHSIELFSRLFNDYISVSLQESS